MIFSSRIDEAIKLASHLHRNQTRIDAQSTPYISHLVSVAIILSEATEDEDIIIAGLMHDSLEDVPGYSYERLVKDCGEKVASIVQHVTEPLDANKSEDEQLPWITRKEAYLENIRKGGVESALISTADKIHNTESLIKSAHHEDEAYLSRFKSSLANKLWFHEQVLFIVEEKLGKENILIKKLTTSIESLKKLV